MRDPIFEFEEAEFSPEAESEENEYPGRRYIPQGRPTPPVRPRRPVYSSRPHGPIRRRYFPYVPGQGPATGPACETIAVLEGFRTAGELEAHHEPILSRLAAHLRQPRPRRVRVEVVSVDRSTSNPTGGPRARAVLKRLRELLGTAGTSLEMAVTAASTQGPNRVEVRICQI